MNNTLNIIPSNNKSTNKYRPYTSKEKIKDNNKKLVRILSAGNIYKSNSKYYKNNTLMDYYNLPSLNSSKSIIVNNKTKKQNMPLLYTNKYKIELEKLYEQNFHYKKIIRKLNSEINIVKKESEKKEEILNLKNEEIENILTENKDKDYYISNIPFCEKAKYSLIKKMRNQLKETEQELNDEILKNLKLKKNYKYTKFNELDIEQKIISEHNDKILSLIENSKQFKNDKNKELIQNTKFNNNLESQMKIIENLEEKYKELDIEENFLKNEIIKHENILNRMTNKVKIIKLKHISLKEQNMKLKKEKENFLDKSKNEKNNSLDELNKELYKAKREFQYNKLKNKKINEKLINVKKNFNTNLEQYKNIEDKNILLNNKKIASLKNNGKEGKAYEPENNKFNDEEYINKLKKIYQENREKENELEQGIFLFQQAIKRVNDGENINLEEIKESIVNSINNKME